MTLQPLYIYFLGVSLAKLIMNKSLFVAVITFLIIISKRNFSYIY